MKILTSLALLLVFALFASAQPQSSNNDTSGTLKAQKDNVITSNTILKIENLGFRVNTVLPELRPTVSADGKLMFFICENHPENTKYRTVPNSQDIWYTEKDSAGKWQDAIHLGEPLNTMPYNAVYWISPDNNRILIRGSFSDGAFNGKGVSMCYRTKSGNWSQPNALNIKNYYKYDKGLQSGATMAHDGKTLLLYMTPEQGGYNNDIFVCFLEGKGLWSEPKSLGKIINMPDSDEMTPYLASDGVTLYFSSNRAGGVGDNDIWMTKRLDKTWQKWSTPVALPVPINTENWDAFWTMDAGGEYAYLTSSSNTLGESDIVRVKLLEREKPNPVVLVHGNVYNQKTKEPLSASLVYETMPDGVNAGNGVSSEVDGSFKVVLPLDKNYSIRATADKFFAVSESLMLESLVKEGYKEIH